MKILPRSFYNRSTLKVAQDLLGCFLVILPGGKSRTTNAAHANFSRRVNKYKIVETEAYNGPKDLASHASRGRTKRNGVMFGPPGIIYVYLIYGMYYMLNIVTEKENYPAAVLIRAVEPNSECRIPNDECRFDGPARLTNALGIDKTFNGLPVYIKKHGLWIESRDENLKPSQIVRTARVGVDYAREYKNKRWRYYIKGNKFVSKI